MSSGYICILVLLGLCTTRFDEWGVVHLHSGVVWLCTTRINEQGVGGTSDLGISAFWCSRATYHYG